MTEEKTYIIGKNLKSKNPKASNNSGNFEVFFVKNGKIAKAIIKNIKKGENKE